jgi:MFS family permease
VTATQVGLLAAAASLPVLLLALFAGVWVDRVRRRPVLILMDLGRAAVLLLVPIGAWLGFLSLGLLIVVALLTGAMTVFFEVAYRSYLPSLVPRQDLVEGNSKLAATDAAAEVGGPALVGAVIQAITAPMAILVDAVSFLCSAFAVGVIRRPEPARLADSEAGTIGADLTAGLRLTVRHPLLRPLAGAAATQTYFGGFYAALYGLFVIRDLHLGPAALGLAVAAGGAGDLIGAAVAARAGRRFGIGPLLVGTALAAGLVAFLTPLASGPAMRALTMIAIAQFVGDMMRSIYIVHATSLRQTIVPDQLLGRVNAANHFLSLGMLPLGAVTAGLLADNIGARATLLLAVMGGLISVLWLTSREVLRLRSLEPTHQVLPT